MDVSSVYAASLGAVFVVFVGWSIAAETHAYRQRILAFTRKHVGQALLITRPNGSGDISFGTAAGISLVIAANLGALFFRLPDYARLGKRLGYIAAGNIVPLLLGGRTSVVANSILGIQLHHYGTFHRWLGRICLVEAVAHSLLQLSASSWTFSTKSIILLSTTSAIGFTSFLFLRRRFFEIFLKLHICLILLLVITLWTHIKIGINLATICLASGSGLWTFQTVWWLCRLAYNNIGGRQGGQSVIRSLSQHGLAVEAMLVEIHIRRPWRPRYGQYVYITTPATPHSIFTRFQAHPFLVAWTNDDSRSQCSSIILLAETRNGFTNRLRLCQDNPRVIFDGPYGGGQRLESYDKVLFIATGIGIAAHLLAIRQLLEGHNDRSARVRRLSLLWLIQDEGHEEWAKTFLRCLMGADERRKIFSILIACASASNETSSRIPLPDQEYPKRWFRVKDDLDLASYVSKEYDSEAGSMAIALCGTPIFEKHVRSVLRRSAYDIHLITTPFKMDERRSYSLSSETSQHYPKNVNF